MGWGRGVDNDLVRMSVMIVLSFLFALVHSELSRSVWVGMTFTAGYEMCSSWDTCLS